jgi:RNA polymerase sigma-70 factor, ECF subfamily
MQATALIFEVNRAAEDSFDKVVRQREAQLLRIAFRVLGNWADAEDVAQEAFLRLNERGLDFPNEAALGAWLYRVTVNLCIDRNRKVRPMSDLPDLRSNSSSAEDQVLLEEQKQRLASALAELPTKERAAIVLREIEGFSTAEVAEILGSSEGTVRSQVSKAMDRLRSLLEEEVQ